MLQLQFSYPHRYFKGCRNGAITVLSPEVKLRKKGLRWPAYLIFSVTHLGRDNITFKAHIDSLVKYLRKIIGYSFTIEQRLLIGMTDLRFLEM